jgi:hypothetical protein
LHQDGVPGAEHEPASSVIEWLSERDLLARGNSMAMVAR